MACITKDDFGQTKDGEPVTRYTFRNSSNVVVRVLNYGGIIMDIFVPDRHGVMDDINLGFDNIEDYNNLNTPYMGALIGRFANRIAGAQFSLDGQTYKLAANSRGNFVHGGVKGFDKVVWDSSVVDRKLQLRYVSADGEEGFPGEMTTIVTYELTDDNQLILQYKATTTKATPINLTNHAYFNLGGHSAGNIDDHVVTINTDSYAFMSKQNLPTGEIMSVVGSPHDLRKPVRLGDMIGSVPACSYNFPVTGTLNCVARVEHPPTGRILECFTTEPSVMFYPSSGLDVTKAKDGAMYQRYGAICLEAQNHPDSINQPSFPCAVLRPGETYNQTTVYKFTVTD